MDVPSSSSITISDNTSKTVRLNVGGTIYEVSRTMLEQYPDTMLARIVSDTWNYGKENAGDGNDAEALFIERNGERFQYILDFMRDGGVVRLPQTVSKDAVLHDLIYFGFRNVDPSKITVGWPIEGYQTGLARIVAFQKELESEKKAITFVEHCLASYKLTGELIVSNVPKNLKGIDTNKVNAVLQRIGLRADIELDATYGSHSTALLSFL